MNKGISILKAKKINGERIKSFLIYALKCISGTALIYLLSVFFPYLETTWSLISVMLVLSPDSRDSVTLAVIRIKANIVAASIVLLYFLFFTPITYVIVIAALVSTLLLCYLFRLDLGIRSALAATIIIMLHDKGHHSWNIVLERIVAVFAGCLVGLMVTFIVHFRLSKYNKLFLGGNEDA